jgi:hypothetical protein
MSDKPVNSNESSTTIPVIKRKLIIKKKSDDKIQSNSDNITNHLTNNTSNDITNDSGINNNGNLRRRKHTKEINALFGPNWEEKLLKKNPNAFKFEGISDEDLRNFFQSFPPPFYGYEEEDEEDEDKKKDNKK